MPTPAPAPARLGGAPRGVALIEGGGIDLKKWQRDQNNECTRAGYPKGCLPIEYEGDDPNLPGNENCTVIVQEPSSFEQRDDTKYVKRGTTITVDVSCETASEPSENTPGGPGENTPGEPSGTGE